MYPTSSDGQNNFQRWVGFSTRPVASYIRSDEHGKHDYDNFQDTLQRTANGDTIYSIERDQQDAEEELKRQEEELYAGMGIEEPEQEAVRFADLHQSAQKAYKSVFDEAVHVLGAAVATKLIALHQNDVPFGVKEYIDSLWHYCVQATPCEAGYIQLWHHSTRQQNGNK